VLLVCVFLQRFVIFLVFVVCRWWRVGDVTRVRRVEQTAAEFDAEWASVGGARALVRALSQSSALLR